MRKDSILRKIPSRIVNAMTRRITGIRMSDWGCMLRGYRREVVDRMVESQEYSTFIPALATLFAKRMTEIPVGHAQRHAGVSNYNMWKLLNLQFDLLTSFSEFPLRVLLYMGTGMAFLGVAFGVLLVVMRIFYGAAWAANGIFTLFAVLFFVAIGTLVDPSKLSSGLPWLALLLALIVGAKVGVAYVIARAARVGARPFQLAIGLGQVGEFSFVLASALVAAEAIGAEVYVALIAAVAVSIAASTILVRLVPVAARSGHASAW